ncbi:MAG: cytochrome [Verrucomicrobiales bacterium]|nr:cytochrome [Verrucomicrobiales bacterium]
MNGKSKNSSQDRNRSSTLQAGSSFDNVEPRVGWVALPIWFLLMLGVLFFWADTYLSDHGGGFSAKLYEPYGSPEELAAAHPPKGDDSTREGKKVYQRNCLVCHLDTGMGGGDVPPLAGSDWVNAEGPNRIVRIVLDGLSGPVKVAGRDFPGVEKVMPPWRDAITKDEDIANLLSYIRQEWGNKAGPVTADEVKKIKTATKDHTSSYLAVDLLKVPDKE